ENVYSYGRESKYFKWTTTLEHTLHAASKTPPGVKPNATEGGGKKKAKQEAKTERLTSVVFPDADALNPAEKPLTLECWVLPDSGSGLIMNHGAGLTGYALTLQEKRPAFHVRDAATKEVVTITAQNPLSDGWHHLAAVLGTDKAMTLFVDGTQVGSGVAKGLPGKPKMTLSLGNAGQTSAAAHPGAYTGMLDQVVIHHRALTAQEVLERVARPDATLASGAALVCTFDNGDARDESGHGAHGVSTGVETGKGKVGAALWFRAAAGKKGKGGAGAPGKDSYVEKKWDTYVPIVTRAMALAGKNLFVAGPPDTLDEEYAFERMAAKDPAIQQELVEQDAALEGKRGAKLWMMNVESGQQASTLELDSPPVWDGMVVARGKLFVATVDGRVKCFGK
ncbi:MAG: LamG domain-containing protein, partial [Verrucomicrobiaceae bacterium]